MNQNTEEAVKNAKEALGLHLFRLGEDKEEIPEASSLSKVKKKVNCSKIFQDALSKNMIVLNKITDHHL